MPRISGWLPSKLGYTDHRVFHAIGAPAVLQLLVLDVMGGNCRCYTMAHHFDAAGGRFGVRDITRYEGTLRQSPKVSIRHFGSDTVRVEVFEKVTTHPELECTE